MRTHLLTAAAVLLCAACVPGADRAARPVTAPDAAIAAAVRALPSTRDLATPGAARVGCGAVRFTGVRPVDGRAFGWVVCASFGEGGAQRSAFSAPVAFGPGGAVAMPRDGSYADDVRRLFPPELRPTIRRVDVDVDAMERRAAETATVTTP